MAKKADLQDRARELGLDEEGTVPELEARIAAAEGQDDAPAEPAPNDGHDRKATGDPAGFAQAPGQGADARPFEVVPETDPPRAGFDPAKVIDNPVANDRRQEGERAPERGVYLDRDQRRRVVAAGDRIPDGWTKAKD